MILNLMLGAKAGGLEQAAVDYAEALRLATIDSITITPPGAWVNRALDAAGIRYQSLKQLSGWDPLAAYRLRRMAKATGATAIICHGNRALTIARHALKGIIPIIVVAHNYQTKHFHRADACFCITDYARHHLIESGIAANRLFIIPNMVRVSASPRVRNPIYHSPPMIGTMGRMVAKKGFEVYLDALAIIASRGITFAAMIGGNGEEETRLRAHATQLGLDNHLTFAGWTSDKQAFYERIDLFVLPSHHEAFGIVAIEAMEAGIPIVSTDTIGPREIIRDQCDGLLVPANNPLAMADAIMHLLNDAPFAQRLAASARQRVETEYSMRAMADRLHSALAHLNIIT